MVVAEYIGLIYLCCVVCMDSFTFLKYMFLCFGWFAAFAAGYVVVFASVVVFYVQHPCSCLKYGRGFHSS